VLKPACLLNTKVLLWILLKHEESRNYYLETMRNKISLLIVGRNVCDICSAKMSLIILRTFYFLLYLDAFSNIQRFYFTSICDSISCHSYPIFYSLLYNYPKPFSLRHCKLLNSLSRLRWALHFWIRRSLISHNQSVFIIHSEPYKSSARPLTLFMKYSL